MVLLDNKLAHFKSVSETMSCMLLLKKIVLLGQTMMLQTHIPIRLGFYAWSVLPLLP